MIDLEQLANPQRRAIDLVREVAAEKQLRPYLVGGPVRDALIGRAQDDLDFATDARPDDVRQMLKLRKP